MLFKGNSSRLEFLIEKIQAYKESPIRSKDGNSNSGSYSWLDDNLACRRGGNTPSSCTTSTSLSFESEYENDAALRVSIDTNNLTGPYSCQFCGSTFSTLTFLKKHEQSHDDEMPYKCNWCARLFKHKRSRDRHLKLHTGDKRYRCTYCEAAFSRSDHLKIHMKTHDNQKPYHCTECSRSYNTTAALTSHMQSHAHKRPRNYTHNARKKLITDNEKKSTSRFNSESPLTNESPLMSSNFLLNSNIGFNNSSKSIMIDSPKVQCLQSSMILRCMYCTRDNFTTMKQLQLHVQAMHKTSLNVNENSPDRIRHQNENRKTYYAKDSANNDYQELSCSLCSMRFKHLATLRNHLITAHYDVQFETTFDCPLCGISCSSTASYAEHYVLVHCENKNIVTEDKNIPKIKQTQEKKSTESNNINNKIDNNYSSTTLLCGQCDAALQDFESFRTHLASHLHLNEQKKNHVDCPKCELKFEDRENMLRHLSKHYMGQMIEQYVCDKCKKYYPSVESLQKHLLDTHTHLKCALCCETFDSVLAIQMHFTMKHVNECSMYHCNSCTLTEENESGGVNFFKSISDFMNHVENIHVPLVADKNETELSRNDVSTSGVLVDFFRCCFCGEGFTVEFLLEKHIAHSHSIAGDTEDQKKEKIKIPPDSSANSNENSKSLLYHPEAAIAQIINCDEIEPDSANSFRSQKQGSKNNYDESISFQATSDSGKMLKLRARFHGEQSPPPGKRKCNICDKTFLSGVLLAEHKLENHCKIQLSDVCIVCREILKSEKEFLDHLSRHSRNFIDSNQSYENFVLNFPTHCIVCRQTLTSEIECLLHAKYHLKSSSDSSHDKKRKIKSTICYICSCEFCDDDVVALPSKYVSQNDQQFKLCRQCYERHSQNLTMLQSYVAHHKMDYNNENLVKSHQLDSQDSEVNNDEIQLNQQFIKIEKIEAAENPCEV